MVPSPAQITPLPADIFLSKLGADVPVNMLRNPLFCFFASFSIVFFVLHLLSINLIRQKI